MWKNKILYIYSYIIVSENYVFKAVVKIIHPLAINTDTMFNCSYGHEPGAAKKFNCGGGHRTSPAQSITCPFLSLSLPCGIGRVPTPVGPKFGPTGRITVRWN